MNTRNETTPYLRTLAAACLSAGLLLTAAPSEAQPPTTSGQASTQQVQPIDINTATVAQLQAIPGIGPTRAQAVVAYRERVGRFSRVEELLRVRGIGRSTFRRIRPWLRLGAGSAGRQTARR